MIGVTEESERNRIGARHDMTCSIVYKEEPFFSFICDERRGFGRLSGSGSPYTAISLILIPFRSCSYVIVAIRDTSTLQYFTQDGELSCAAPPPQASNVTLLHRVVDAESS